MSFKTWLKALFTAPVEGDAVTITVNGMATTMSAVAHEIAYESVVWMAGYEPHATPTVTYFNRHTHDGGSLLPGKAAPLLDGMVFTVADTGAA